MDLSKLNPRTWPAVDRQRIYDVALALGPLLIAYGLLSSSEVAMWLGVVGAALSVGGNATSAATLRQQRADGTLE